VKDDPYRVPQRRYGNLMDHVELDHDWNVKPKSHMAMQSTTSGSSYNVESDKSSKEVFRVNILDGNYIGQSSIKDKMVVKQLQMKIPHLNRKRM
jgi:hypothetical protein